MSTPIVCDKCPTVDKSDHSELLGTILECYIDALTSGKLDCTLRDMYMSRNMRATMDQELVDGLFNVPVGKIATELQTLGNTVTAALDKRQVVNIGTLASKMYASLEVVQAQQRSDTSLTWYGQLLVAAKDLGEHAWMKLALFAFVWTTMQLESQGIHQGIDLNGNTKKMKTSQTRAKPGELGDACNAPISSDIFNLAPDMFGNYGDGASPLHDFADMFIPHVIPEVDLPSQNSQQRPDAVAAGNTQNPPVAPLPWPDARDTDAAESEQRQAQDTASSTITDVAVMRNKFSAKYEDMQAQLKKANATIARLSRSRDDIVSQTNTELELRKSVAELQATRNEVVVLKTELAEKQRVIDALYARLTRAAADKTDATARLQPGAAAAAERPDVATMPNAVHGSTQAVGLVDKSHLEDVSFGNVSNVVVHTDRDTGQIHTFEDVSGSHVCYICGTTFANLYRLKIHRKAAKHPWRGVCKNCNKVFYEQQQRLYASHISSCHAAMRQVFTDVRLPLPPAPQSSSLQPGK